MERRLEGLVAVVTGGGRGIGRAWCERLAHHGARVVVNDAGVGPRGDDGDDDDPAAEVVAALTARGTSKRLSDSAVCRRKLLMCNAVVW